MSVPSTTTQIRIDMDGRFVVRYKAVRYHDSHRFVAFGLDKVTRRRSDVFYGTKDQAIRAARNWVRRYRNNGC